MPAPRLAEDAEVKATLAALGDGQPRSPYGTRRAAQAHGLPVLPTTTIGSFPQTPEVRKARADRKAGRITGDAYEDLMRGEIDRVIALQEDIGLDVLVHGEPERNDMVQYFAEQLDGFAVTEQGWVWSYGSRYCPAADPAWGRAPARADDRGLGAVHPGADGQAGEGMLTGR